MNFKKDLDSYNVVVCGSVDDGKSTLIGKLIHDTNNLYKDQIFRILRYKKSLYFLLGFLILISLLIIL